MKIKPLNVLGAEVSEIDLSKLLSKDSISEVHKAIDEFKVLIFRY